MSSYESIPILKGGDELFSHPRFTKHFEFMDKEYIPRKGRPVAFFLSCSKHKPYYKSPYRRVFNAMLESKLRIRSQSQIYTISEPAIVVPEELDDTAVTRYDFPPDKLQAAGRKIFVKNLQQLLPKLLQAHNHSFYVLPRHHRSIFEEALQNILDNSKLLNIDKENLMSRITYAPPVIYNLPKAKAIITKKLQIQLEE